MRLTILMLILLAASPLAAQPAPEPMAAVPARSALKPAKPAAAPTKCEGTTDFPVPRFASIKPGKAFARSGPEDRFPISWVYIRKGLPVEIIREYCIWRQVRDPDGEIGWLNKSLLSGDRTAIVTGGQRSLYVAPDLQSRVAFRIDSGTVVRIMVCDGLWCRVSKDGQSGYVLRAQVWGTYPNEAVGG